MAQMPVFNDFTARQGEIARRRKMAEMLQLEGMKPLEQQTAGGMVVPISPVQGLAKMLQTYIGTKGLENAATQDQAVAAERNKALVEALQSGPKTTVTTVGATPIDDEGNPNTHIQAPTDSDRRTYMAKLLQIGPDAVAAGQSLMAMENQNAQTAEQRAFRERERAQDRINQQDRDQAQIIARQEEGRTQREAAAAERQLQREWQERQERSRREWELRNRQGPAPQIVQTEQGPMQVGRDGKAVPITGPDGKQIAPKSTEKAMPASASQKLLDNRQNLRQAERALALIQGRDVTERDETITRGDANATGFKSYLPDSVLQRTDQSGIPTRAAIGDLGSLVIHDRSGAAVTAAEFPRLRPFIPLATDDPKTVQQKLKRFVAVYRAVVEDAENFYKESGYKVPGSGGALASWGEQGGGNANVTVNY